jgi:hypothetical protein
LFISFLLSTSFSFLGVLVVGCKFTFLAMLLSAE